jgi:hypothetical protein
LFKPIDYITESVVKNSYLEAKSGLNPYFACTYYDAERWWFLVPRNFLATAASLALTFPLDTALSIFLIKECS